MPARSITPSSEPAKTRESFAGTEGLHVPTLVVPRGPWDPADLPEEVRARATLIVVEGLIMRHVRVAQTTSAELLGPGDLVARASSGEPLVPTTSHWYATTETRLAIIDDRVAAALAEHPRLVERLLTHAGGQTARMTVHRAISQLPRIEERILAIMWQLAERWGRVGPDGVIVPIALTHETLGQLVGAARPTVSLALKALGADELLSRRADGAWLLSAASRDQLEPDGTPQSGRDPVALVAEPSRGRGEPASAAPRPHSLRGRMTRQDIASLHRRIEALRSEHESRRAGLEATLEAVRVTRERIDRQRFRRPTDPGRS